MTKRGARTSKSEPERVSTHAPASSSSISSVHRAVRSTHPMSLAEEASLLGQDEREAELMTQFFSWPPPHPLPFVPPKFERPPLSRESRRAMWASILMLFVTVFGIGGMAAYQQLVMPQPAELGQWRNIDSSSDESSSETGPVLVDRLSRNVYQASLQDPGAAAKPEPDPGPEAAETQLQAATAAPTYQLQPEPPTAAPEATDLAADTTLERKAAEPGSGIVAVPSSPSEARAAPERAAEPGSGIGAVPSSPSEAKAAPERAAEPGSGIGAVPSSRSEARAAPERAAEPGSGIVAVPSSPSEAKAAPERAAEPGSGIGAVPSSPIEARAAPERAAQPDTPSVAESSSQSEPAAAPNPAAQAGTPSAGASSASSEPTPRPEPAAQKAVVKSAEVLRVTPVRPALPAGPVVRIVPAEPVAPGP